MEVGIVESECLRGNRAGDPHRREVPVYVPPVPTDRPLPVVFLLSGFTGRGQSLLETHPWREGPVVAYDRAVAAGEAPPALLVLPDCFTKLGGSQYVNSSFLGSYEDHVTRELVAYVDREYQTLPGRRGVAGKSSGGFGALHLAMRHPDVFRACASISGDCAFEYSLAPELLVALRGLVDYDMDPARFLDVFLARPDLGGDRHAVINVLAMAACYSPNPDAPLGFDLPIDLATGERAPEVWERWLAFDPLRSVHAHRDALASLDFLHLECGMRDEFHLQWGLRLLVRELEALGVPHTHEEHPGGHRGIDDRYAALLPRMIRALQPG